MKQSYQEHTSGKENAYGYDTIELACAMNVAPVMRENLERRPIRCSVPDFLLGVCSRRVRVVQRLALVYVTPSNPGLTSNSFSSQTFPWKHARHAERRRDLVGDQHPVLLLQSQVGASPPLHLRQSTLTLYTISQDCHPELLPQ